MFADAATPITDSDWQAMNKGGIIGTNGGVAASVYRQGKLYAGGNFTIAGGAFAKNLAVWDGEEWSALGRGANKPVRSMVQDKAGDIYVSGDFDTLDGVSAKRAAKWDGNTWTQLGNGLDVTPLKMVGDSSGTLYALQVVYGTKYSQTIRKWNGSAWDSVPSLDTSYSISDIAIGGEQHLFACGRFRSKDDIFVMEWDGTAWKSPVDSISVTGHADAMAIDSKGVLYIGGWFGTPSSHYYLARITDGKWQPRSTSGFDYEFTGIDRLQFDKEDNLFVLGESNHFTIHPLAGMIDARGNQKPLLESKDKFASTGPMTSDGKGGVYFGETYWDGSESYPLKSKLYFEYRPGNSVKAILPGGPEEVYLGGLFQTIGGLTANSIARWDRGVLSALGKGAGKGGSRTWGEVSALTFDAEGRLIMGGNFTKAGDVDVRHIAKWDGQAWSSLGTGFSSKEGPSVNTLIRDPRGNILAGGLFDSAGGARVNGVALWDGSKWSGMEDGLHPYDTRRFGEAKHIALDSNGNLIVAGAFGAAGNAPANGVAKWNGTEWRSYNLPDSGMKEWSLTAVAIDQSNEVYAAGYRPGGLIKRTTDGWKSLGFDDSTVFAIAADGEGNLYVGGSNQKRGNVMKYDGKDWSSLGSGTNGPVHCLAIRDSTLYVGGAFTISGDKLSPGFAKVDIHSFTVPGAVKGRDFKEKRGGAILIGDMLHLDGDMQDLNRVEIFSLSGKLLVAQDVQGIGRKKQIRLRRFGENVLICRLIRKNGQSMENLIHR